MTSSPCFDAPRGTGWARSRATRAPCGAHSSTGAAPPLPRRPRAISRRGSGAPRPGASSTASTTATWSRRWTSPPTVNVSPRGAKREGCASSPWRIPPRTRRSSNSRPRWGRLQARAWASTRWCSPTRWCTRAQPMGGCGAGTSAQARRCTRAGLQRGGGRRLQSWTWSCRATGRSSPWPWEARFASSMRRSCRWSARWPCPRG
mmetsp:Transcript_5012/g.16833  ORF Transcript_5012/g.16833 Transcript_5012/m.16833 type:complete len:204 (+) Transcript_5012:251-862(+)